MRELILAENYGDYEFKWQEQYGMVYKVKGCFGQERLMVSDPTALKCILSDNVIFARSEQHQRVVRELVGEKTLAYVHADHRRLRNIMNPAFSASYIRTLPPVFKKVADCLVERWETAQESHTSGSPMDIFHSLHDASLDAIGEAVMGFSVLTNPDYMKSYHDLLTLSSPRSNIAILVDALIPFVPMFLLRGAMYLPTSASQFIQKNKEISAHVTNELFESRKETLKMGDEIGNDLLSNLVKATMSDNAAAKMTHEEFSQVISTVVIAGHETTANAIAWALYELAKNPEYQEQLRQEITTKLTTGDPNYSDLDALIHLNAFIKEVLRVYATLPVSERQVTRDTVIPLSQPIITVTGEHIHEIPVEKGQHIAVTISAYNKLVPFWGKDALEFKPSRWIDGNVPTSNAIGPYANLLTFLGGSRVCIGWRFAIMEIQVILSELLRHFTFTLPAESDICCNVAFNIIPVAKSSGSPSLPLIVTRVE
ncbi:cytochrome P450 [Gymnopus androsaceus JB14]|uniref:Cytochrome P450 n=1 Tax=Gymnopus androsaceus JB14 TaxID=1447944 RepID=A0A6A4HTD0_9AGAR|nr:cytochrome P450 [Gymnopus androsaceus JB14]